MVKFNTLINKNYLKFKEEKGKSGYQDIYDIKGNFKDAYPTKLKLNNVKQIVIKQMDDKTLRILFEDRKNLKTVYFINRNKLVIKVLDKTSKTAKKSTTKTKVTLRKTYSSSNIGKGKIVVVDAGHGGKDPGAVGANKRYEKVVAFKTTKYLESILKKRGYKVFLTRNSDKFIKVRNRPIIANKKKADIFISIHANAVPKHKRNQIKGIETYFLSPARSERAKRVAARENQTDIKAMSNSTKLAFLESLNRPRITASHKLAIDVQKNMLYNARKQYKDTVDMGVREGPFYVLVGAQMPSILIELGFISHPIEAKRLYQSSYQKKLALGVANGIDAYFAKNP